MSSSVLDSPRLNKAQRQAVSITKGPLLVIAGAGSGKTLTLTHRAAYLIEQGVPPESVLLLTFTRKAAQEMLRRAAGLLDARCQRIAGGTFHAFAHQTLRRHGKAIGLAPHFTIMDRPDAEEAIGMLRHEMGLADKDRRFPKRETIADLYSKSINCAASVEDLVERETPQFVEEIPEILRILSAYARYKTEHALLDYDDLLVYLCRLLEESPPTRDSLSRQCSQIQVDEYQDTNLLQARILKLLTSAHDNIMVVGDDCQSIYSFRGARVANILDFPQMYPGTRIVKLEENYRSVQSVLDLTNEIVVAMSRKYEKKLVAARRESGERPQLMRAVSDRELALAIARAILEEREEGRPLSDMAVLFRSAYHSFELELALAQANIPFVKWGGIRFMETAHLKDALAFLRVTANRHDRIAWLRLLQLAEGVGQKTAGKLVAELAAAEDPAAHLAQAAVPAKAKRILGIFSRLLGEVGRLKEDPVRAVEEVTAVYGPILREKYPDDASARQRDLDQFLSIAARYKDVRTLLSELALDPISESVKEIAGAAPDEAPLVLSTIHSAKGLEWGTVFVLSLVEGKFPPAYAGESGESIDEERRLFYVACTRAKDRLVLTHPVYHFERAFGTVLSRPSRFLEELPGHAYKELPYSRVLAREESWDDGYAS